MEKLPNEPGIYIITNLVNNKYYIGSTNKLRERKSHHYSNLNHNRHANKKLQYSWNKYGIENFTYTVLEVCNIENLINREQYYIDTLLPFFNIRQKCESNRGFKHSEESKQKISKASKELWKVNGQKLTESLWKPVLSYDKDGNFIKEYKSVKEAAKDLNLSGTNVSTVLKGKNQTCRGIHLKYKIDNEIPLKVVIPKKRTEGYKDANSREVEIWLEEKLIGKFKSKGEGSKAIGICPGMMGSIISGRYFIDHSRSKLPKYKIIEIKK